MPRSDSRDLDQCVGVSFMTLPFWWSSALFSPHIWASLQKSRCWTVADIQCFPRGQCFAAATWGDRTSNMDSFHGFTHPWESVQHRLWWEGALQDWAAQRFFCTWCDIYKHGLLSCSLRSQDMQAGLSCPFPPWQEGRPRAEKSWRDELWLSLAFCHFGCVLFPAWASDISRGYWVRKFPGGFTAFLKCHLCLWLAGVSKVVLNLGTT